MKERDDRIIDEYKSGKGMKTIAREEGMSYSGVRYILLKNEIVLRKNSDVTDHLRNVRSKNLKLRIKEHGVSKTNSSKLGINGYYWNRGFSKWVFLRSGYEFIYARWLDEQGKIWDVEVTQEKINGVWYRPDFFLYDKKNNLTRVIEIKSKYIERIQNFRSKDVDVFQGVPVERIYKIEPFIPKDSSYSKELRIWKKIVASNKNKQREDILKEESANKEERRKDVQKSYKEKREWRECICGKRFFVLKTKKQSTCGNPKCYNPLRGKRTTREATERWEKQREDIVSLYKEVRIPLIGRNNHKSLKPFYFFLKKESLPCHINTLRKIFNVKSLNEIIDILEESLNVPHQK
jgi:hypothetical protein